MLLECILDAYIMEFNMKLGKEIFISDMMGWSETSSILRIMTVKSEILNSGNILSSKYKNLIILLEHGELKNNRIILDLNMDRISVPNNLNWSLMELQGSWNKDNPSPEEFDEVQIVYNRDKHCIENTNMMGRVKFKEYIRVRCGICNE